MIRLGEACPVEQSSAEAKSLKTKGQGTVRLLFQWAAADAARRGPVGLIKGYSHDMFTTERESWKAALCWTTKGQKAARQRKSITVKERSLLQAPGFVVAEGEDEVGVDVGEWEPGVLITSPRDSVSVSEG
jgi:hypothetical protein